MCGTWYTTDFSQWVCVCVLNLNKIGVHYAPQSSPGSPLSLLQLTICAHARVNSGPPKDNAVLYDVLTTVMFT